MRAFRLSLDNALLFYEVCHELNLQTEEERLAVMDAFVHFGRVDQVTDTPKTKEEYLKHLAKHFNVAEIKNNGAIESITPDAPKEGNNNGTN